MIIDFIKKHFKVWGVKFEVTDLPPEFIISVHAQERLIKRVGIKKEKIPKFVIRAWYSKDVDIKKLRYKKYNQFFRDQPKICREMMGYVFIFAVIENERVLANQKVLVTVI